MATTFEVIFLGTLPVIDTVQGNEIAENAAGLLGSYGTSANPLSESIQTLSPNYLLVDDNTTYDTDNRDLLGLIAEFDSFRIDGGAPQNFDALTVYDATITYFDGTTATISAVVFQDVNGNTYLAPELALNADQAALTAKPITSLSLNSVLLDNGDLQADRIAGDFKTVVDGTAGNDVITQSSGYVDGEGDSITSGADFVLAGAGNDSIDTGDGNDVAYGELGNDTILGGNGNDTLFGGDGADRLIGGNGNDSISGGTGDDYIESGGGTDTIDAGDGNDVIAVSDDHGTNFIDGGGWYDQLVFATPTSTAGVTVTWTGDGTGTYDFNATTAFGVFTSIEQSSGTIYADTYNASDDSAGTSVYALAGDDTLIGGSGADRFFGEDGNDSVHAGAGADTIDGGAGVDYLKGQSGDDSIVGGSGTDTLTGDSGADTLDGGLDNDSVAGGSGADSLLGGDGNDNIRGDNMWLNLADYPSTVGTATTLTVTNTAEGPIELWFLNSSGVLEFRQSINAGQTVTQAATTGDNYVLRTPDGFYLELIEGGNQTVVYGADGLNDTIDGGAGNDTIYGEFGDDSIFGGDGADLIYGGYGNDYIDAGQQGDTVYAGFGNDTIDVSGGYDLAYGEAGDDLLIDGSTATFATTLYGGDGNDTIQSGYGTGAAQYFGDVGDDLFEDRGGTNQTFMGGFGSDTYVALADIGNDTIIGGEDTFSGSDVDTIDLSALTTPVTVTYTGDEAGTITDGTNTITFSEIEHLILTGGNDTLRAGADSLGVSVEGREGNDQLLGGSGNDTLDGGEGNDQFDGGAGDDSMLGGAGGDSFTVASGADTVIGGTGRDAAYVGDGFNGSVLDFGGDEIAINSGSFSEVLSFYDVTTSVDIVFTSGIGGTATSGAGENLTFSYADGFEGAWGVGGTFDASLAAFDVVFYDYGGMTSVTGSAFDDLLAAYAADPLSITDRFYDGGAGNDTLDTGDGNDTILGGDGNDEVVARGGNDSVDAGAGSDIVYAGSGNDSVDGGSGDDLLYGEAGNDTLVAGNNTGAGDTLLGGSGDDLLIDSFWNATLDGGTGNDTIQVGYGAATVTGGEDVSGTDVDWVSFSLADDAATVTFSGDEAGTYTDSDGDSGSFTQIEGVIGSNQADSVDATLDSSGVFLSGMGGDDTLLGGTGDDILTGGDGADVLTGGDGADVILAEAGADTISAGSGNDYIEGGTGDDLLSGGDGDDYFTYNAGDGLDTISDFNSGNSGALLDGDTNNNDFIDLSSYYDTVFEIWADQADDGVLNQSNLTDTKGNTTDYSDNLQFGAGEGIVFTGATADSSFFATDNTGVVCFARGTLILTTQGEVPVERLSPGAMIVTRDNGPQPLVWLASRKLGRDELARAPKLRPIRLAPDLVGAHTPLIVSPQHAVLFRGDGGDETLVRATHLARMRGGKARVMQGCRQVSYFHLAFEAHQIIFANGAATESFYPGFHAMLGLETSARLELAALFPDLVPACAEDSYGLHARPIARYRDLPDHLGALSCVAV